MKKKKEIEIPESGNDVQIVHRKKEWFLKYGIGKRKFEKIDIGRPCEIVAIRHENGKQIVEINILTSDEFKREL